MHIALIDLFLVSHFKNSLNVPEVFNWNENLTQKAIHVYKCWQLK